MKRFKFILKNRDYQPVFYGNDVNFIISSVLPDEEIISYEEVPCLSDEEKEIINRIKNEMEFEGYMRRTDHSFYEVYKNDNFKVRLLKIDNEYYAYADYQMYPNLIEKITWTVVNLFEIDNLLSLGSIGFEIISRREYSEPKLSKPKELKGIKSIGSVDYIPKHSKPQLFIKDNDLYIKHNDYFSYYWQPPVGERIDMPLSYYANKYFNKKRQEKFIYPDCWGSIILRNEAWLCIKNGVSWISLKNKWKWSKEVYEAQKKTFDRSTTGIEDMEWLRFWEGCYNVLKNN